MYQVIAISSTSPHLDTLYHPEKSLPQKVAKEWRLFFEQEKIVNLKLNIELKTHVSRREIESVTAIYICHRSLLCARNHYSGPHQDITILVCDECRFSVRIGENRIWYGNKGAFPYKMRIIRGVNA